MRELKVLTLTNGAIKVYVPTIAKLRRAILKEYPYKLSMSYEEHAADLSRFVESLESISILVFHQDEVVGNSLALPLELETSEIRTTFLEKKISPHDYFFFSESLLLPQYRGRGMGHHFFEIREAHAQKLKKFKFICFRTLALPLHDPYRPPDYISLEGFWQKLGYRKDPRLSYEASWKDVRGDAKTHLFHVWTKSIQKA